MNNGFTKAEKTLSLSQQEFGLKIYLWFTRVNAFSFGCLADNMLILYAIRNGADDFIAVKRNNSAVSFFDMLDFFFDIHRITCYPANLSYGKRNPRTCTHIDWP